VDHHRLRDLAVYSRVLRLPLLRTVDRAAHRADMLRRVASLGVSRHVKFRGACRDGARSAGDSGGTIRARARSNAWREGGRQRVAMVEATTDSWYPKLRGNILPSLDVDFIDMNTLQWVYLPQQPRRCNPPEVRTSPRARRLAILGCRAQTDVSSVDKSSGNRASDLRSHAAALAQYTYLPNTIELGRDGFCRAPDVRPKRGEERPRELESPPSLQHSPTVAPR